MSLSSGVCLVVLPISCTSRSALAPGHPASRASKTALRSCCGKSQTFLFRAASHQEFRMCPRKCVPARRLMEGIGMVMFKPSGSSHMRIASPVADFTDVLVSADGKHPPNPSSTAALLLLLSLTPSRSWVVNFHLDGKRFSNRATLSRTYNFQRRALLPCLARTWTNMPMGTVCTLVTIQVRTPPWLLYRTTRLFINAS